MKAEHIEEIFSRFKEENPHPKTELKYSSDFELLIAVMLSAQATDVSVNKATKMLFAEANSPRAIIELGLEKLKNYIKTIGLYNTKAKNVIATCEILMRDHNGKVPQSREQLEQLPGVGRKTANVVLNTAFRMPTMAVDTHIFRVSNRTGIGAGRTVLAVEKALLENIADEFILDAHHWLILHGRYICVARKPRCGACVISDLCEYEDKIFESDG